jgi:hypothetical protein
MLASTLARGHAIIGAGYLLGSIAAVLLLGGYAVIAVLAIRRFNAWVDRQPADRMAYRAGLALLPALGGLLAVGVAQFHGLHIRQQESTYSTLLQVIATLIIAVAVEAFALRTSPAEDSELPHFVSGLALGSLLGLVAAVVGTVIDHPGLFLLFTAAWTVVWLGIAAAWLPIARSQERLQAAQGRHGEAHARGPGHPSGEA